MKRLDAQATVLRIAQFQKPDQMIPEQLMTRRAEQYPVADQGGPGPRSPRTPLAQTFRHFGTQAPSWTS